MLYEDQWYKSITEAVSVKLAKFKTSFSNNLIPYIHALGILQNALNNDHQKVIFISRVGFAETSH